ncbi:MAG: hypothetical protein K8F60_04980 [Melioribacteraceae bacterium]|nr:hypothetical protein [Melioribacteraceae bacterium]
MKYLIKNKAIIRKAKLYKINSVIDLPESDAEDNPNLEPVKSKTVQKSEGESSKKNTANNSESNDSKPKSKK